MYLIKKKKKKNILQRGVINTHTHVRTEIYSWSCFGNKNDFIMFITCICDVIQSFSCELFRAFVYYIRVSWLQSAPAVRILLILCGETVKNHMKFRHYEQ